MSPRFLFSSKLYLGFLSQNPYVTQLHTAEGLCSFIQSKYKQSLWKDPHFSKREIQIFSIPEAAGMALNCLWASTDDQSQLPSQQGGIKPLQHIWHDLRQPEEQNASTPFYAGVLVEAVLRDGSGSAPNCQENTASSSAITILDVS